ncbi:MAG: FAD-binding oxidoreductase [Calditrichaeota bacterium]|nr:FAD-binding oxidoreductase [Calditrichota bacterium]
MDRRFPLEQRPHFWPHLRKLLPVPEKPFLFPPRPEEISLPPSRLTDPILRELHAILPDSHIARDDFMRLVHTYGKSYRDLIRIRLRQFPRVPDAVLFPDNEDEIIQILRWATRHRIAVVPRGGGTSVVGGVECVPAAAHQAVVVMNLCELRRVLEIDPVSYTAEAEAGITGPELESALNREGFTLGHFPESFHYSTLGGWVATRSAGQQSTRYGKIEHMVESIRVITPEGIWQTPPLPAAADGPDFDQLFIGSEGVLGVISRVRVHIRPLPERKYYTAYLFPDFTAGVEAVQHIIQEDLLPATIRLSDPIETDFVFALRERPAHRWQQVVQEWGLRWLAFRGYSASRRTVLILGLEGGAERVKWQQHTIHKLIRRYRAYHLGESVGQNWYRHRFDNPYLRDELLNYNLLVETLETASDWSRFWPLYEEVRAAIQKAYDQLNIPGIVFAHLSHVYETGTSLYFVLLAVPENGKELEQWAHIKRAASEAILKVGGTISHHHGVGLDHRPWIAREIGRPAVKLLQQIKQSLDPEQILNPGKLIPDLEDE